MANDSAGTTSQLVTDEIRRARLKAEVIGRAGSQADNFCSVDGCGHVTFRRIWVKTSLVTGRTLTTTASVCKQHYSDVLHAFSGNKLLARSRNQFINSHPSGWNRK